jgi:pyridoxal 5'-phosphate synthase pdxS subunit
MTERETGSVPERQTGSVRVKRGLAEMLRGGVIMDVVTPEQAKIAEDSGAVAVMALERVPADIRRDGGVARMSDPAMIEAIQAAVTVPVMAKCRIGHFAEAQVLEALGVDYIDESEVLTPADEAHHIDKWAFTVPFVCGATNLGEALRRIAEGAAMIRTKGEAGTGNVVEAVRHERALLAGIAECTQLRPEQYVTKAKDLGAPGVDPVYGHGLLDVADIELLSRPRKAISLGPRDEAGRWREVLDQIGVSEVVRTIDHARKHAADCLIAIVQLFEIR